MEQKREAGETEAVTKRQSFATGKYTVAAPDASAQEAAAGSGHEHPPRAGGLRPAVSTRPTANSPWAPPSTWKRGLTELTADHAAARKPGSLEPRGSVGRKRLIPPLSSPRILKILTKVQTRSDDC